MLLIWLDNFTPCWLRLLLVFFILVYFIIVFVIIVIVILFCCLLFEEEQVANESNGKQHGVIGETSVQINSSGGDGLTELEKLLKQKTFTRYALYEVFDCTWNH